MTGVKAPPLIEEPIFTPEIRTDTAASVPILQMRKITKEYRGIARAVHQEARIIARGQKVSS